MDGLAGAVGNGITTLVRTAFDAFGGAIRGIVAMAEGALPGGWLLPLVFVGLLIGGWVLAKR